MENTTRLSVPMTQRETSLGWFYLLFQLFFLPGFLQLGNAALPAPLPPVWLNLVFFSVNFLCILCIFHNFLKESMISAVKNPGSLLTAAGLGFVLYWASSWTLSALITALFPAFSNVNDSAIAALAGSNLCITAIGTVFLVPLVEEALYRGLIFQGLYRKSKTGAYLISALAFCAIHVMGYIGQFPPGILVLCFLQYLPAGLILAWSYAKADTIFAPILIHTLVNAMGILALR